MEQQTPAEAPAILPGIHHNAPLTSSEISILWRSNSYYDMLRCIYKHFLNTLEDPDLRPLIEDAVSLLGTRVNLSFEMLRMEGQPNPEGFGNEDVDLGAPRLFTDLYYYYYTLNMLRIGLLMGSTNLAHSVREDVRNFYTKSLLSTTQLFNRFSKIMLKKGIYIRSPIINTFKKADIVDEQNFLRGFLGQRRPLLAQEVDQLFFGITTNQIAETLLTGFQQTARSKQVRAYMARGTKIAMKHIGIFSSALEKEKLSFSMHSGELVTDSTTPPFSDRFMMQHIVALGGVGLGNYATSMSLSLRHDLSISYSRLMGETANYLEDGLNIMIENGWFEEPLRTIDQRELSPETIH